MLGVRKLSQKPTQAWPLLRAPPNLEEVTMLDPQMLMALHKSRRDAEKLFQNAPEKPEPDMIASQPKLQLRWPKLSFGRPKPEPDRVR